MSVFESPIITARRGSPPAASIVSSQRARIGLVHGEGVAPADRRETVGDAELLEQQTRRARSGLLVQTASAEPGVGEAVQRRLGAREKPRLIGDMRSRNGRENPAPAARPARAASGAPFAAKPRSISARAPGADEARAAEGAHRRKALARAAGR